MKTTPRYEVNKHISRITACNAYSLPPYFRSTVCHLSSSALGRASSSQASLALLDRDQIDTLVATYALSRGYRYGSDSYRNQGQEKDDEAKGRGNSYDFGARRYDSRLGRWLTIDPLAGKYPSLSPFNFVANSPIIFVDPDGRDIEPIESKELIKLYVSQLRAASSLDIRYNAVTGKLIYNGNPQNAIAKKIAEGIDNPNINVEMYLSKAVHFSYNGIKVILELGSFLGNSKDDSGNYVAQQIMNPVSANATERLGTNKTGAVAAHETIEAIIGIELHPGYQSGVKHSQDDNSKMGVYDEIHGHTSKNYISATAPEYGDDVTKDSYKRVWFIPNWYDGGTSQTYQVKLDPVIANFDVLKKIALIERVVKVGDQLNTK